jgi:hypothetical protein
MAIITETNAQYYSGQQVFPDITAVNTSFKCTFETDVISAFNSTGVQIHDASNYTIYVNGSPVAENLSYISDIPNNIITLRTISSGSVFVQLKQPSINKNYDSYSYVSIVDIVNNFMVAYVGMDKLIPRCKRSDVIFHAKRGLQEFSYDTLKSIKSQELTIPPSLSLPIPQDYVNYVRCSWIDLDGVQRIIYPVNNLTADPTELPLQDSSGIPTQNSFGGNNEAQQSFTEERWQSLNTEELTGDVTNDSNDVYDYDWWKLNYGQRYGLEPEISQSNGWFNINERLGTFSFSSGMALSLIVLEYISDGLSYDMDTRIPKMAEDALYAHIMYSIIATRANFPEYIVQRYKKERSAKLRNAKIRLSNLKLDQVTQVMRGKSKWIK